MIFPAKEAENKTEIENPSDAAGDIESKLDQQINIETEVKEEL